MRSAQSKNSVFQKVGPCLYRYKGGTYYARFKSGGKEIRCSLETADRKLAERNLAKEKEKQSQIDRSQGKLTLAELCNRYLQTVRHQKPRTVERKTFIVERMKRDWPTGRHFDLGVSFDLVPGMRVSVGGTATESVVRAIHLTPQRR
jgi:hypothetical protein